MTDKEKGKGSEVTIDDSESPSIVDKIKSSGSLMQMVVMLVIALVASYFMIGVAGVSRSDHMANMQGVVGNISALGEKVDDFSTSTSGKLSTIETKLSTIDALNNEIALLKTDIANIRASQSTIQNDVALAGSSVLTLDIDLQAQIDDLVSELNELSEQVEELENSTTVTADPVASGDVTASVRTYADIILLQGATTLGTTVKITVTNNTDRAINDIVLSTRFLPTATAPSIQTATLTGGVAWTRLWDALYFANQWGLDLTANETKTIMASLSVTYTSEATTDVWYQTEIEVEDFD